MNKLTKLKETYGRDKTFYQINIMIYQLFSLSSTKDPFKNLLSAS